MIMLVRVALAFILPCIGITAVFTLYLCVLWYAVGRLPAPVAKVPPTKGLSTSQIQCLPVASLEGAADETECAVCLEAIGVGQPARVLPLCSHAFHVPCVDAWLARNAICPLCRAKLGAAENDPQQNC